MTIQDKTAVLQLLHGSNADGTKNELFMLEKFTGRAQGLEADMKIHPNLLDSQALLGGCD